ncbi:hypothetical protein ACJX0J_018173, partial [Zea mays]
WFYEVFYATTGMPDRWGAVREHVTFNYLAEEEPFTVFVIFLLITLLDNTHNNLALLSLASFVLLGADERTATPLLGLGLMIICGASDIALLAAQTGKTWKMTTESELYKCLTNIVPFGEHEKQIYRSIQVIVNFLEKLHILYYFGGPRSLVIRNI